MRLHSVCFRCVQGQLRVVERRLCQGDPAKRGVHQRHHPRGRHGLHRRLAAVGRGPRRLRLLGREHRRGRRWPHRSHGQTALSVRLIDVKDVANDSYVLTFTILD